MQDLALFIGAPCYQKRQRTKLFRTVPKVRIDLVVASEQADKVVAAIQNAARVGEVGDGKIFVSPIERAVRIRTGETDEAAL